MLCRFYFVSWPLVVLTLVIACSQQTDKVPDDIACNTARCVYCNMLLSDRKSAVQIHYLVDKNNQLAVFDDFGCAVLWLEDKPWSDDPQTEIWITDHRTGEWINARLATYLPGIPTPMAFGLGAQLDWQEDGLSFTQARLHVIQQEQRLEALGKHLLNLRPSTALSLTSGRAMRKSACASE